jgi:hypothetical protein
MRFTAVRCFPFIAPCIATYRYRPPQPTHNRRWQPLLCAITGLLLLVLFAQTVQAADNAANTLPEFGAMPTLGEALEPCETDAQLPTAKLIDKNMDWQAAIQAGQPGDIFLMRAGAYTVDTKYLVLPAGASGQPVTIKPYNCEAVTLYASVRPQSYNTIAGLHIETQGIKEDRWVIRVDGKQYGHITGVIIRNNTILGGTYDAIRVMDDTANVQITGNQIDGGGNGHVIFVTAEDEVLLPDQIEVSNNLLTKAYYKTVSEDMFQVRDVLHVTFSHNTCINGYGMEQCVDIKSTRVPLLISDNLFAGDQLHLGVAGEDGAGGCMVIHETDGDPQAHLIQHNFFRDCKGTIIRFAAAAPERGEISSAIVQDNLITASNAGSGQIPIFQARNVEFNHNTLVNTHIKLGDADRTRTPQNTTFRNNVIYQTVIDDHASDADADPDVACRHNLLYGVNGNNFDAANCTHSITEDPQFVAAAAGNFQLQPTSPAATAIGDDGRSLGAAIREVPPPSTVPVFTPQIFLPQLRN